jgi:hypothetical protein
VAGSRSEAAPTAGYVTRPFPRSRSALRGLPDGVAVSLPRTFGTIGTRVRYREAVAEATMEGELIPPVAAVALKAVNDAGDDLYRDKTGVDPGAFTVIIERLAPLPGVPALPPPRSLAARSEPIATAPSPASVAPRPPIVVAQEDGIAPREPMPAVEIERLETLS